MKHWRDILLNDWRQLKAPLLGLCGSVLICGALLLAAHVYREQKLQQLNTMHTQQQAARTAADRAEAEFRTAIQSQSRYRELVARGLIGQEHRRRWVERLHTSREKQITPELQFRIEPQKPLEQASPVGQSVLYASRMNLRYRVRHEEAFSKAHRQFSPDPGLAVPLRCQIERIKEGAQGLAVDCDYLWLTIAPAQNGKEKP